MAAGSEDNLRTLTRKENPMAAYQVCDYCACVGAADTMAEVHIRKGGTLFTFHYHNTLAQPCLRLELERMRRRFLSTNGPKGS